MVIQRKQGGTDTVPDVLSGFEHINRYWDRQNNMLAAKILPGEYYVTRGMETIVTVLGSCISACIRDSVAGIGGMNHFLLPISGDVREQSRAGDAGAATRYGNYAMEHMINVILANGGNRRYLEVKICGGSKVLRNMNLTDIGGKNIEFVRDYIRMEGLNLVSADVGGEYPRKVHYTPATGRLMIKKLRSMHNDTIIRRELEYKNDLVTEPISGDIELF